MGIVTNHTAVYLHDLVHLADIPVDVNYHVDHEYYDNLPAWKIIIILLPEEGIQLFQARYEIAVGQAT